MCFYFLIPSLCFLGNQSLPRLLFIYKKAFVWCGGIFFSSDLTPARFFIWSLQSTTFLCDLFMHVERNTNEVSGCPPPQRPPPRICLTIIRYKLFFLIFFCPWTRKKNKRGAPPPPPPPFFSSPLSLGKKGCAVDFLKNKALRKEPEVVDKVALVKSFRVIAMKM